MSLTSSKRKVVSSSEKKRGKEVGDTVFLGGTLGDALPGAKKMTREKTEGGNCAKH